MESNIAAQPFFAQPHELSITIGVILIFILCLIMSVYIAYQIGKAIGARVKNYDFLKDKASLVARAICKNIRDYPKNWEIQHCTLEHTEKDIKIWIANDWYSRRFYECKYSKVNLSLADRKLINLTVNELYPEALKDQEPRRNGTEYELLQDLQKPEF